MKNNWILFVALRYIFKGRNSSPVLAVLGIAVGVLALIVIISVMNGFQLGFIESILEISSYHIRLESFPEQKVDELLQNTLSVAGVTAAVPFREYQALARGNRAGQQTVLVRGLNEYTLELDEKMAGRLDFEQGGFDISNNRNILLGAELAARLGVFTGDEVSIFSITSILSAEEGGSLDTFTVTGVFRSGYYEYDSALAIINIENTSFLVNESDVKIGIKLSNRFQDGSILDQINKKLMFLPDYENIKISSWREYNRSFFGALRTEKLFMFILVALIFLVVGLNIFQAQRRAVLQRSEEIGLLRAVGGTKGAVKFVFVFDGAVTGLTGASIGLLFGLLISSNIPGFFILIENIVNIFIDIMNIFSSFFGTGRTGTFYVFSPAVFYIKEIPSRLIPFEAALIFGFGFLSALTAAWFASRKISNIQPVQVLRYE